MFEVAKLISFSCSFYIRCMVKTWLIVQSSFRQFLGNFWCNVYGLLFGKNMNVPLDGLEAPVTNLQYGFFSTKFTVGTIDGYGPSVFMLPFFQVKGVSVRLQRALNWNTTLKNKRRQIVHDKKIL